MVDGNGCGDVADEQRVADIVEGGDAEHHVGNGTDSSKPDEIHHCLAEGQQATHFVDSSYANNDYRPHGGDEHGKEW